MLMLIVTGVLAGWCLLAVIVAVAVGRAAKVAEVKYQDQVFLRGVAMEATRDVRAAQLAVLARG